MSEPLFSPSWYRVAHLRPRLLAHARFHRHRYRGQLWYVIRDPVERRCHRLSPAAYQLAGLMDGARSTREIWEIASERLGDDGPSQDETIRLLGLLHLAGLLRCDVSPDTEELFRRTRRRQSEAWWRQWTRPLSLRIPLVDPDAFLERALPFVRPLFSKPAAAAAAVLVAVAVALAGSHFAELSQDASERLLRPGNLLVLWLAWPVLKGLHELGHAFATRHWGGEVHEMGILLLVFVPIPYVDASDAAAFPDKWRRAAVGAAGVAVELVVASLALLVWLAVSPGALRSLAFDLVWIGGASSLLFNGNPLLRYDGYYVLCDLLEIPNLAQRSRQYLAWLVQRFALGLERVRYPVTAPGEPKWFVAWGVTSFLYRVGVVVAIALFVAGRFFVVGVLLAVLTVSLQLVAPVLRHAAFVVASPRLAERRGRALALAGGALASGAALLLLIPLPLVTRAQGVILPPDGAQVRAGADGFVVRLLARPDETVGVGQALLVTRDPELAADVAIAEARLRQVRARHRASRSADPLKAALARDELAAARAELEQARERAREAVVRSPADGRFVVPEADALPGLYVRQGRLLGFVVGAGVTTARVALPQSDVALVRHRTRAVAVRLAARPARVLAAGLAREVPAASDRLPSAALGSRGGGPFAVDPADPEGLRALEPVFQLDVQLSDAVAVREIGGRVHVRFDHGFEPVAWRGLRSLRRLFLERLGV